jgi:uncharacterized membrane protein YhaH (DUF805 family)
MSLSTQKDTRMLMFQPLRKYADFKGRARRAEYWYFALFQSVAYILLCVFAFSGFGKDPIAGAATMLLCFGIMGLMSLALIIPSLALLARRLHDINLTAWWMLLMVPNMFSYMKNVSLLMTLAKTSNLSQDALSSQMAGTSIIGIIAILCSLALFVMTVWPGTRGDNRFGPDPKGGRTVDISVFDEDRVEAAIAEAKSGKRERDPDYKPVFDFTSPAAATDAPRPAPTTAMARQTPTFGKRR